MYLVIVSFGLIEPLVFACADLSDALRTWNNQLLNRTDTMRRIDLMISTDDRNYDLVDSWEKTNA